MTGRRARLRALVVGLLLVAFSGQALGFVLISPLRRWYPRDLPREIYTDPRGRASVNDFDNGLTATLRRIEAWEVDEGVGNIIRPIVGTPGDPTAVPAFSGADGISTMRFDDPAGICTGSCIAAATTGGIALEFSDCNGENWFPWVDSDIVFNVANSFTSELETDSGDACSFEYYLEQIALHEVGHLLGLGHSSDSSAVMYAFAGFCQRGKTNLRADDEAGIRFPYDCDWSQDGVFGDEDGDGFGQDQDCDDYDPTVFPGAPELCDLKDNDCDTLGDAAEGLVCGDLCVDSSAGLARVTVSEGACQGEPTPGVRRVYVRGSLDALPSAGSVDQVETFACPSFSVYDTASESSPAAPGESRYYLVRDDADTDFGQDAGGTPRTPVEDGCP